MRKNMKPLKPRMQSRERMRLFVIGYTVFFMAAFAGIFLGRETVLSVADIHVARLGKGLFTLYDARRNLLVSFTGSRKGDGPAGLVKNFTKFPAFHKETKQVTVFDGRQETVTLTRKTNTNSRSASSRA